MLGILSINGGLLTSGVMDLPDSNQISIPIVSYPVCVWEAENEPHAELMFHR